MLRVVLAAFALAFFTGSCTRRQYVRVDSCDFPLTHEGAELVLVGVGVAATAPRGSAVYKRKHAESGKMCHFEVTTDDCRLWAITAATCEK